MLNSLYILHVVFIRTYIDLRVCSYSDNKHEKFIGTKNNIVHTTVIVYLIRISEYNYLTDFFKNI